MSASLAAADNLNKIEVSGDTSGLVEGISLDESLSLPASFSNSVQVFTREKIERLPVSDVFQVLDMAAGVSVSYHGRKALNLLGMRSGSNLGIILDGALIPTPSVAKILAALPLSTIEKIEVVRDSSALNLGPLSAPIGAMTDNRTEGFVVITTRSALDKKNSLTASVDNKSLRQIGVSHAVQFGDSTGVRATLNHAERKEVDGNNKGYKRDAGYIKASHVADTFWIDFSLFHSKGRTDLQRAKKEAGGLHNAKWSYDPTEMTLASLQAVKAWSETQATTLRASYTESDATLYQRKYNPAGPGMAGIEKTEENFFSIDLSHAAQFGIHNLRAGLTLVEWDNPTGMLHWPGIPVKERTHSAYLQDEFSVGNWSFDGGIRVDKRYLDKGWDEVAGSIPPKKAFKDRKLDPLFALSTGALYKFNEDLNATFRFLFTQQDPTGLAAVGDTSLPKEKRMRYELGLNKFWASYLTTKATFFWDHLADAAYIADQATDENGDMYNLYSANTRDNKGVELILLGSIQNFSYDLSYSYVKPGSTPTSTVNTPKNLVKLHLAYAANNWSADLTSKYVDKYLSASHAATDTAGDFITTDIQVARVFKQSANLSHKVAVYVKNLEDKKYETMFGFPDEGRSFGLTYQLNY